MCRTHLVINIVHEKVQSLFVHAPIVMIIYFDITTIGTRKYIIYK